MRPTFYFIFLLILCLFSGCKNSESEPTPPYYESKEPVYSVINSEASLKFVPSSVTDLVIPSTVTIDNKTYAVTRISSTAFRGIENLNSLTIPSSLKTIEESAFSLNGDIMRYIFVANLYIEDLASWCSIKFSSYGENPISLRTNVYVDGDLLKENLTLPTSVTSISPCAFENLNTGGELILHDGINYIGQFAFTSTGFTKAKLPANLEEINHDVFLFSKIESIKLPESLKSIGSSAFSCCRIKEITFPETLQEVGVGAFSNTPLSKIYIPSLDFWLNLEKKYNSSPKEIYASSGFPFDSPYTLYIEDKPLTDLVIPENISEIKDIDFCNSLIKSVYIPEGVTKIDVGAFMECTDLETLTIDNKGDALYIKSWAFYGCNSLRNLDLPGRVILASPWIFSDCTALKDVNIGDGITYLPESCFDSCSSLQSINLPSSLMKTDTNVFNRCSSLKNLIFPEGFIEDHNSIVDCSSLEMISYPSSVKYISSNFYGCDNLKAIEIKAFEVPETGIKLPKESLLNSCILYVPTESLQAYKESNYWGSFKNITGVDFSD